MKVTKRMVNTRRHTIGYLIGGKWRTRAQAVRLAMVGKVDDVVVRRGSKDEMHIAGRPMQLCLSNLPTKVERTGIVARRAARR